MYRNSCISRCICLVVFKSNKDGICYCNLQQEGIYLVQISVYCFSPMYVLGNLKTDYMF